MSEDTPVLHMLCGKAAAGKSTLCERLVTPRTIVIAQDHWMSKLYTEELQTVADYIRLVPRLRGAIGPHVVDILRAGLCVVMDWPANTIATRAWMRSLFESAGASHQLHFLDVPDEICLARLQIRNAEGRHEYSVSRAEFKELSRYFEPPTQAEGFDIVIYREG